MTEPGSSKGTVSKGVSRAGYARTHFLHRSPLPSERAMSSSAFPYRGPRRWRLGTLCDSHKALILVCAACLLPGESALAAMIFGTIQDEQGQPVAQATLQLQCPQSSLTSVTDANGGYRLVADEADGCTLSLTTKAGAAQTVVDFYEEPSRYDFIFGGPGKLTQH